MRNDKSMPPPARPLSKEQLTSKVKEFPVNYGASIVGVTTVETLAGGPPSTDLTYVLEGARSAVTFAVPLDEDKTRDYLGKIDREGHQQDYTRASIIADGIAAQLASFLRQFGHPAVAVMQNLVFRNDKPGDLDHRTPDIAPQVSGGSRWRWLVRLLRQCVDSRPWPQRDTGIRGDGCRIDTNRPAATGG